MTFASLSDVPRARSLAARRTVVVHRNTKSAGGQVELREVIYGFVVLLAATLNFGFFVGDISDPAVHHPAGLIAAVAVNLIATVLKWGDRTQLGAVQMATSLVADLQLIVALTVLGHAVLVSTVGMTAATTAVVVSLSGGALLANLVSVTILVVDLVSSPRR